MKISSVWGALLLALVLSGCGGGGGGEGVGPPSSVWDTMVWDQGNWG